MAIMGDRMAADTAAAHGVHPNQITIQNKQVINESPKTIP